MMNLLEKYKGGPEIVPDDDKMKEMILYVANQSEGDKRFGATKLNKILFFSDFFAYLEIGKPITGQEYFVLPHGPALKKMKRFQQELIQSQACAMKEEAYFGYPQKKLVALKGADLGAFSGSEVKMIDGVIKALWDKNAEDVSELSHKFAAWQAFKEKESIPYESIFVMNDEDITEEDKKVPDDISC